MSNSTIPANASGQPLRLSRAVLAAATALLPAAALGLLIRRGAGLWLPPSPALAAAFALGAVALVGLVRWGWRRRLPHVGSAAWRWTIALLPSLSLAAAAVALTFLPKAPAAAAIVWLAVVAEELWAWLPWRSTAARSQSAARRAAEPAAPPGEVLQQWTRTATADGGQRLTGRVRMPLCAGQRTGSVHVAFCPPFPGVPKANVTQVSGLEARVKLAQLLPHGARLEVRLCSAAASPADVVLEFDVRSDTAAETAG